MKNITTSDLAQVVHEILRAFGASIDETLPAWHDAPQWMRDTTVSGVQFHLDNPSAGIGASHQFWMDGKLAEGWVLGEVKDYGKKTHPSLVPYEDLPLKEKQKDVLFVQTVHSLKRLLD